jgi:DNA polymerase III epsilon subunit-like protein
MILVYDFETVNGTDPRNNHPIQLAAKVLNPRTLEPVNNGEFHSFIKPDVVIEEESLAWHAKARHTTPDKVSQLWENAPTEKQVWSDFAEFTKRFHLAGRKASWFTAPIRGGCNILNYDNIIWDRLCVKYGFVEAKRGTQSLAFPRDNLDIQPMLFWWFENYDDAPENLNMDALREYFGITHQNGHDAYSDVDDTIIILQSFMKLFRRTANGLKFKGALRGRR